MTLSFLADENISPESADYLEALGHSCHSLRRDGPWRLSDREIVILAKREGRVILTHDLDGQPGPMQGLWGVRGRLS